MPELPDIERFECHKVVTDIDIDGTAVPGLRGTFYRRPANGRIESVGVYHFGDREVFRAWGFVGEPHCRYTAVRRPDGSWDASQPGCPRIRVLRTGAAVTGLVLGVGEGGELTLAADQSG